MKFNIEDVEVVQKYIDEYGEYLRLTHKPSQQVLEFTSKHYIFRSTRQRLIAQLKVMVNKYGNNSAPAPKDSN